MKKIRTRHNLLCCGLIISAFCTFLIMFAIDVIFIKTSSFFTVNYSCFLFPIFSVVYGEQTYKITKRILVPNMFYFAFCLILVVLSVLSLIYGDMHQTIFGVYVPELKIAVVSLFTGISAIVSCVISVASSLINKFFNKMEKRNRDNNQDNGSSSQADDCSGD